MIRDSSVRSPFAVNFTTVVSSWERIHLMIRDSLSVCSPLLRFRRPF